MLTWEDWKKGFDIWEEQTAQLVETMMRSPAVLGPAGQVLSGVMRAKAEQQKAVAEAWSAVGLPTRRDQERTLYALQQLQSRLGDLEEQLGETRAELAQLRRAHAPAAAAAAPPASAAPKSAAPMDAAPKTERAPKAPRASSTKAPAVSQAAKTGTARRPKPTAPTVR